MTPLLHFTHMCAVSVSGIHMKIDFMDTTCSGDGQIGNERMFSNSTPRTCLSYASAGVDNIYDHVV